MRLLHKQVVLCLFFLAYGVQAEDVEKILEIDQAISNIPGLNFTYEGGNKLSREEAEKFLELALKENERMTLEAATAPLAPTSLPAAANCPRPQTRKRSATSFAPARPVVADTPAIVSGSGNANKWQVVFLARLHIRSESTNAQEGSIMVTPSVEGAMRLEKDMNEIRSLHDAGKLDSTKITNILSEAGQSLKYNPDAAMAYVAALGKQLVANYGDSNPGSFISRFEQYGRLFAGESVGQCSDIHFAMLKAYKQMVGPNAKAYLVNFQTSNRLHHTNLIIENNGQLSIVDYGNITTSANGRTDILAQDARGGHGIAYRIFTDDGEIDKMVAHIDTPLGKFLREVSIGTSSYNPFESTNYSMITTGFEKNGGSHVKVFFGELGGGDVIMGVAVNLSDVSKLPAGFSLQSYISSALAYTHNTFRVDNTKETLHSGILYINTGLGLISPKLALGDFTFQARTDLILEGGVWIKKYSAATDKAKLMEGDFNLVSRSRLDITWRPTRTFKIAAGLELELVPSFKTAFPSSTNGSSGADGLVETLGVMANRVTASIEATVSPTDKLDLYARLMLQSSPIGEVGEARIGAVTEGLHASTFISGTLDSDTTPIFVPGARREVGFLTEICSRITDPASARACFGGTVTRSIEGPEIWAVNAQAEIRY